jgi:hypothetical protein
LVGAGEEVAWGDAELFVEDASAVLEEGDGVGLAFGAVEGGHEEGSELFAEGVVGDEVVEFGDELVLSAEDEVGFDAEFEGFEALFLEVGLFGLGHVFGGVGEGVALPEVEGVVEVVGCLGVVVEGGGVAGGLDVGVEGVVVEGVVGGGHAVAGADAFEVDVGVDVLADA